MRKSSDMKVTFHKTPITGLLIIETGYFQDERGFLTESWHKKNFQKKGLNFSFVQEVHSRSKHTVTRGLHYQDKSAPLEKLIRCIYGKIFAVAVDLRTKSPTFGKWFSLELSAENKKQIFVPAGFAFGFATLSDFAEVLYKFSGFYNSKAEKVLLWNDKDLKIDWPFENPLLSKRDEHGKTFLEYKKKPDF